jgi:hypothetical protein
VSISVDRRGPIAPLASGTESGFRVDTDFDTLFLPVEAAVSIALIDVHCCVLDSTQTVSVKPG